MSALFTEHEKPIFLLERQGTFTYNARPGTNHCGQTTGNRKLDYHVSMRCINLDGRGFCLDQDDVKALFVSRAVRNSWASFSCERMAFDVAARLIAKCHLDLPGYAYGVRARIHRGNSRTGVTCDMQDTVTGPRVDRRNRLTDHELSSILSPAVAYYIAAGYKYGTAYQPEIIAQRIDFNRFVSTIREKAKEVLSSRYSGGIVIQPPITQSEETREARTPRTAEAVGGIGNGVQFVRETEHVSQPSPIIRPLERTEADDIFDAVFSGLPAESAAENS